MGFLSGLFGGKKPKRSDYKATESERALAAIASADYGTYKQQYAPYLRQMRDQSENYQPAEMLRGRANASTAQVLKQSDTGYRSQYNAGLEGQRLQALSGSFTQSNKDALGLTRGNQINVLSIARQQRADTVGGLASAASRDVSSKLHQLDLDQQVSQAKSSAILGAVTGAASQGQSNLKTGGTFFTPKLPVGPP